MTGNSRKQEIAKAIKALGWFRVSDLIRTPEDRKFFNELAAENDLKSKNRVEQILRKIKVTF